MAIYTGTEGGPHIVPTSGAIAFNFRKETISTILGKPHSSGAPAVGIRFHFDTERPTPPNRLIAVGVTGGLDTKEIFTPNGTDYIPNQGAPMTKAQFDGLISVDPNGKKRGTCVYISRMVLENHLSEQNGQSRSGLRLFVVPFPNNLSTLTSVALDGNGMMDGSFVESQMPCPPSCGTDYNF